MNSQKIIIFLLIAFLIYACNKNQKYQQTDFLIPSKYDTTNDSLDTIIITEAKKKVSQIETETNKTRQIKPVPVARYVQYPGLAHCNGKALVHQLEMNKTILKNHADSLHKIAKLEYRGFEDYFPRSIADNFEEGISTEHIHYCDILFKFQVFEDEYSLNPHSEVYILTKIQDDAIITKSVQNP
jgi:hypothetical protein